MPDQMFFFLTPLYASSATWSLQSFNWWLAPLLLICAIASTLDLVFENVAKILAGKPLRNKVVLEREY